MNSRYATPAAFRRAVEDRLRVEAAKRSVPMNDLRQKLVMERLLARLFLAPDAPWLLKGGYAMDLRFRPHARTTRDLDLSASADAPDLTGRLALLRQRLQDAADIDAGEYLVFRVGAPRRELPGPPFGGARLAVIALLAGKEYARFHIDAGFGDPVGEPDTLTGEDFFAFAGLAPARAVAIPGAQQFAEKIHAYTFPWRVKDLVDLVVLIERGNLVPEQVRAAVAATFAARQSHAAPSALPDPPAAWSKEFAPLAREAGVTATDVKQAAAMVSQYWLRHRVAD